MPIKDVFRSLDIMRSIVVWFGFANVQQERPSYAQTSALLHVRQPRGSAPRNTQAGLVVRTLTSLSVVRFMQPALACETEAGRKAFQAREVSASKATRPHSSPAHPCVQTQ